MAVAIVVWIVGEVLARRSLRRAMSEGWPSGRLDAILGVFPKSLPTASALALETEARQIGIDLEPRTTDAKRVPPPAEPAWKAIEDETKKYIAARLSMTVRAPVPAPPAVAAFLSTNSLSIGRIEELSESDPAPQWQIDLSKGLDRPLPNLPGHVRIVRLLVASALHHDSQNDAAAAWRDLHAASRLPDGLFRRPEATSQVTAVNEATMVTGAMRHLSGLPPQWASQWPSDDLRARLNDAATVDAWTMYRHFDTPVTTDLFHPLGGRRKPTLYWRVLSFILSPYLRASAANTAMAHRKLLREVTSLPACTQVINRTPPSQLVPAWNVMGRAVLGAGTLESLYQRMHLLLAQIDGTDLILEARRIRQSSGEWPAAAPKGPSRCSTPMWAYARTEANELLVTTTTPLAVVGPPNTLRLPLRHLEQ
jgi:hypothetical protein